MNVLVPHEFRPQSRLEVPVLELTATKVAELVEEDDYNYKDLIYVRSGFTLEPLRQASFEAGLVIGHMLVSHEVHQSTVESVRHRLGNYDKWATANLIVGKVENAHWHVLARLGKKATHYGLSSFNNA